MKKSKILFHYNKNYYSSKSIKDIKVTDFANEKDKKANGMSISVTELNEETKVIDSKEQTMNYGEVKLISIKIEDSITYYNIVFNYDGSFETLKVENNKKMIDIVRRYAEEKNLDPIKLVFIYDGSCFLDNNFINNKGKIFGEKTVEEFANKDSKEIKGMSLIVYDEDTFSFDQDESTEENNENKYIPPEKPEEINFYIIFEYKGSAFTLKTKESEKMEVIINKFISENEINPTNVSFHYNNNIFNYSNTDLNDFGNYTIKEFANNDDKERKGIIISVNEKVILKEYIDKNNAENAFVPGKLENITFYLVFEYNGSTVTLKEEENEKIKDIIKKYTSGNNINEAKVYFLYNAQLFVYDNKGNNNLKEFGDKTIKEFANELDKKGKTITFLVYDGEITSLNFDGKKNVINPKNNMPPKKTPIHIFFNYDNHPPYPLNVEENEKTKDVFMRYALENELSIEQLDFFYIDDKNPLKMDSIGEKAIIALSNVSEKIKL